jgi:hypothetical protein
MNTSFLPQLSKETLLIIPCSGAKQRGCNPTNALPILSSLAPVRAAALAKARAALRENAPVDERTLMPAYRRYSGRLYKHAATFIGGAVDSGQRVMIVSGGYGLLLADEPIGTYDQRFRLSDWPGEVLEGCILDYAHHEGIRSVIAVMASTTAYAKLIRGVKWRRAGLEATLVSPVAHGGGAMVKVPRAQGEAVAALINAGLDQTWLSPTDSLSLKTEICEA